MNDSPKPYESGERRPITTRDTGWARRVASMLVALHLTPNVISVAGMFAGMLAGAALAWTAQDPDRARLWWGLGAVLIQCRLMANMLDGMVAVQTKTASPLGELYNEIPDRISDAATLIGLGYALGSDVTLGYVAACIAVFVAYIRAMGKVAGAHQEFGGPLAKPQRMFLVTLAALYGTFAPASWPLQASATDTRSLGYWMLMILIAGSCVTVVNRLLKIARALKQAPTI